jgi:hypothetical protein
MALRADVTVLPVGVKDGINGTKHYGVPKVTSYLGDVLLAKGARSTTSWVFNGIDPKLIQIQILGVMKSFQGTDGKWSAGVALTLMSNLISFVNNRSFGTRKTFAQLRGTMSDSDVIMFNAIVALFNLKEKDTERNIKNITISRFISAFPVTGMFVSINSGFLKELKTKLDTPDMKEWPVEVYSEHFPSLANEENWKNYRAPHLKVMGMRRDLLLKKGLLTEKGRPRVLEGAARVASDDNISQFADLKFNSDLIPLANRFNVIGYKYERPALSEVSATLSVGVEEVKVADS